MATETLTRPNELYEITDQGVLNVFLHRGQVQAWNSTARFVVVTAGTQSGKTSFGPLWLEREIRKEGPGDYLIVTPTFQLLDLKALPEFRRYFEEIMQYGRYLASPRRHFVFSPEGEIRMFGSMQKVRTKIWFGYADDPESLESATIKAAWLDEAGQKKFKLASWYAILRRLSLAQGRVLLTTTPYNLGWLYLKLFLPYARGESEGEIEVVNFRSIDNPLFPIEEYERAKADLPPWMFSMLYDGLFVRPAGVIYDNFDRERHVVPRMPIPSYWKRFVGLDFGARNTVAVFYAEEPRHDPRMNPVYYLYKTYKGSNRTAKQHVRAMLGADLPEGHPMREPRVPQAVGGSASEIDYRNEYRAAGLPVMEPVIREVEVGIERVYGAHARNEILVFDDQEEYLEQKQTYSRETDNVGNVLETIEDKHAFHFMDAERYVIGWKIGARQGGTKSIDRNATKREDEDAPFDIHGNPNPLYR